MRPRINTKAVFCASIVSILRCKHREIASDLPAESRRVILSLSNFWGLPQKHEA